MSGDSPESSEPSSVPGGLALAGGVAAAMLAALIWGSCSVISRLLLTTTSLDASDLAFLRYAGALPLAILLLSWFPRRLANDIPLGRLMVLILLAGPFYQGLLIYGYGHATAGAGALIVTGLVPVLSLALVVVTRDRAEIARHVTSLGIGSVALILFGLWLFERSHGRTFVISAEGIAAFTLAALMWAVVNTLIHVWRIDPLRLTVVLIVSSPLFLPFWLAPRLDVVSAGHAQMMEIAGFVVGPTTSAIAELSTSVWQRVSARDILLQVVIHGWLGAIAATGLFFHAIRVIGATRAAIMLTPTPAFSATLGAVLLGERLSVTQIIGLGLACLGMAVFIAATARAKSA